MEAIIGNYPDVASALLTGQGRRRTSLSVQAKEGPASGEAADAFITTIWPTIERANNLCSAPGKISRDLILFTSATKPMLRAGKSTIQRGETLKQYKDDFDRLYG